ncbi:MAG: VWA domain-containing protein [Gemmatimonadota bacterium]|nr:MAG: VWA domain-containing protein [Gemmatimonadota bacterium]
MRKAGFVFLFFLCSVCIASADVSVAILKGEAVEENKAALYISAVDDAGRPIKGLSEENFVLFIGGEKIEDFALEPASTVEEPLSIILGVDVSGSMRGRPFEETQKAISIFLDQLEKKDFVVLMSFGTAVRFMTDFTQERYIVRTQVEALRPVEEWTHLYDATYEALKKGKDAPTTRTAVILLTDGKDEGSERVAKDAVDMATGASVPVFTLGFGHDIDSAYLQGIAQVSGGDFATTPEPERIPELYQGVLDQLKNQYMISFDFAKEPSTYKASLSLTYGNLTAKSTKEFLFNPTGAPIVVAPPVAERVMPPQKPWYESLTRQQLIVLGSLVVVLLVLIIIYIERSRKKIRKEREEKEGWMKQIAEMIESSDTEDCELEYPSEYPTIVHYFDSRSGQMTQVARNAPDVLLQIDCLKSSVPLVHEGVEVLDELIIAKKSKERASFRKKGVVYLWTRNEYVSRASQERDGHARIFVSEGERFAIEDLGSMNGTWIGGKKIDGTFPLQDGDVIDLGGKDGIRIVYRESDQVKREFEQTMVSR